ncbi:MAG: insulinase family protein, partial [Acidobacteriaceae bacterium]|nr:insulinase family protein [Acidobacteriaceae bacterium]
MSHDVAASPRSGLCPTRVTLGNGLTVLAKRTTKTPAVTMSLALRVGSICDADRSPGECYLLSRVIDRGTATRSAADIAEALDARGTSLTATVTRHLLTLALTCLAEDFEAMLTLMGDIVMHPAVPAHELDVRKREVVTAIRQDLDNPAVQAA